VAAFRSVGIAAEHVDGKTPPIERDAALARFETGETTVMSNVDLFGEGFDLPALECVIMLRPTWSLGLYLQMLGRALRPAPGKPHAIAIDLVGNWKRHGLVSEDRRWSLSPPPPAINTSRSDLRSCRACSAVSRATASFCPACDAPQKPRKPDDLAAWEDLIREPGLSRRLRTQPLSRAITWAESEHQLRQVALARGFKPGWAFHRWREREAERGRT
jgi:DNA repair protein RadD